MLIAFVVIICLSGVFWFIFGEYIDTENNENRELATQPRLTMSNYKTFPIEYEAYFNDNIPFRNNLIAMNSAIDYFVFNKSSNEEVIIGEDDWLFYSNAADGNPIGNYQGTPLFSDEELEIIADNCVDMKNYFEKQNKEFVLFIAPNKERIYSEKMPKKFGEPAETYKAKQVVDYLRENTEVRVVYPYDDLMDAKNKLSENIWYKTDTHWNSIGGYVGATELMEELGVEMPHILSDEITISKDGEYSGDLAGMLNLLDVLGKEDYNYNIAGYKDNNMKAIEWDFHNAFIYHAEGADSRKIYVCRDSFSTQMAEYIGSQFSDSYFRHISTYSYEDLIEQDPDIFVYETVERYVDGLTTFSIQKQGDE